MITKERINKIKHDIGYFHLEDSSIRGEEIDEVFDLALLSSTLTAKVKRYEEAGNRLVRTMDNFDYHPLAKEALIEYRAALNQGEGKE